MPHTQAYLDQDQQPLVLGVGTLLPILSITAVILRFVARIHGRNGFWWDDWIIILALLSSLGTNIATLLLIEDGFGLHIERTPNPEKAAEYYFHNLYPNELMYNTTLCLVKFSILCFYVRVFPVKKMKIACYTLGTIVATYMVATTFVLIFQCFPPSKFWDRDIPGTCINLHAWFIGQAIPNIITDVFILLLPIPFIYRLNMPSSQKWAVAGIFATGSFVTIASIVRLVRLAQLSFTDVTWNWVGMQMWSDVEPSVAVVCGCLPSLAPLFKSVMLRFAKEAKQSKHFSWIGRPRRLGRLKRSISLPLEAKRSQGSSMAERSQSVGSSHSSEKETDLVTMLRPDREMTTSHADNGSPNVGADGHGWPLRPDGHDGEVMMPMDSISWKREICVFQEERDASDSV